MADLKIGKITLGVCATNCYFIYEQDKNKAIVVDPADDGAYIYSALKDRGFEICAILLTHGHFDHIWGCSELRKLSGAKVYALKEEEDLLQSADLNVSAQVRRPCTVKANTFVSDGDELTIEGMTFKVIATPGHTKGSCCFYFEDEKMLISGDTLFEESVGRTDLPTGSMSVLNKSIKEKLAPLPDDVTVYPGHGNRTTIGHEKNYNPFWG